MARRILLVTWIALSFSLSGGFFGVGAAAYAQKPVLNVYTYESFASEWGPGPVLKQGFEAICACTVNFTATDDAIATFTRLVLEGENTPADVIVGLDSNLSARARATGLFIPHGLTNEHLSLPIDWDDPLFVPFDWGAFAFIYRPKDMPTPPTSLAALRALPDEVKIVVQDPRTSTPGLGLLLWIDSVFGNEAPAVWQDIADNIVTFAPGWWDAYSLYLAGQADMVLSYTTSPAYHRIVENDDSHAAAAFAEGHYLQIETAALVKTSNNVPLARQFLQYLVGQEMQSQIPTTNWMLPVRDDVSLDEVFIPLMPGVDSHYRFLYQDDDEVEAKRQRLIDAWRRALQ